MKSNLHPTDHPFAAEPLDHLQTPSLQRSNTPPFHPSPVQIPLCPSNRTTPNLPAASLPNPRHEAFAQAVASGQSAAGAYARVYGQTRRHAAAVGGSRLFQKSAVHARIQELQSAAAQDIAADLHHLLHYLARVINTPISEVTASSDLCLRRKSTAHGEELVMPDKLTAVALAAKLQGFFRIPSSSGHQSPPPPPHGNVLTEEERLIIIAEKRAAAIAESESEDDDEPQSEY